MNSRTPQTRYSLCGLLAHQVPEGAAAWVGEAGNELRALSARISAAGAALSAAAATRVRATSDRLKKNAPASIVGPAVHLGAACVGLPAGALLRSRRSLCTYKASAYLVHLQTPR